MHTRIQTGPIAVTFILFAGIAIGSAACEQRAASRPAKPGKGDKAMDSVSPELARLELVIGPWRVTETHFNTGGDVVATVKGTEEITWILDRHAIRRVYTTTSDSTVFRAIGTLTWNDLERKYHGVWFDNVSAAGPAITRGEWTDATRTVVFILESLGKDGSTLRYKVVERFLDEERRAATTYLIKGTEMAKRMEVQYERAVPCPARVRPIFDDSLRLRRE